MGMNSHPSNGFPEPSNIGNSNRDPRISLAAPGSSVVVGNDCLNPTLLGKYVDREPNTQAVSALSRWPLLAGDLSGVAGGAGESGMQQNGLCNPGGSGGGAVVAGNGNANANAQRNLALLGDGAQSLPSLKDSGLLDSWGSSRVTAAVDTQKQASSGSSQQQSLTVLNTALSSTSQHYTQHQDVGDLRPTTLGMPVGMSWLANESR